MAVSQSISLTQGEQSVEKNTTQVTFKWTSTQSGESYNAYTKTAYYYVSINGGAETKYSVSYTLPKSSIKTIVSKTFTVDHKDDGTGSISIRTWMDTGISAGVVQKSKSLTLSTIPRASTFDSLSCSTSYFNGTFTYKYSPKSANFYNLLNIYIKTGSDTYSGIKTIKLGQKTAAQQTGTVLLSDSELSTIYGKLPTTTKETLRFTLRTYSDSEYTTKIGSTVQKDISLTIPTTVVPKLGTITLDPVNITTSDGTSRNILVQGKNKIKVSISGCKPGSGSSIKSYTFTVLSGSTTIATTTTTNTSATFGPFSKTGSLKFRVTVTDNRSRSTNNSGSEPTQTCYDYEAPTFSSFTAYRCNSNGTADDNGKNIKYSFEVSYKPVNSTNMSTVKIYYKKSTDSSWTSATNALTNSTTKSASAIIKNSNGNIEFNTDTTYMIYATVIDNYNGSVKSSSITVFGTSRIFNIRKNGSGIAFGKMAESNNLFESKWPMKVDDKITFGNGVQGSLYTDQNSESVNIVYLLTGQNTSAGAGAGIALHNTSLYVPSASNSGIVNLGSSGRKWNQLYAASGTISTSDRNVKTNIENMSDTQEKLFNELKPVTYKFIDGTSDRTHYGFISQDIEESLGALGLNGSDFAGFCKDVQVDEDGVEILDTNGKNIYDYSLRYSEFIALNTHMIQKLQAEIAELKAIIEELKSTAQN